MLACTMQTAVFIFIFIDLLLAWQWYIFLLQKWSTFALVFDTTNIVVVIVTPFVCLFSYFYFSVCLVVFFCSNMRPLHSNNFYGVNYLTELEQENSSRTLKNDVSINGVTVVCLFPLSFSYYDSFTPIYCFTFC